MSESSFVIGQRWVSNSEAELGLGIVKENLGRRVEVAFPAAGEDRTYAADNAPLSRVQYSVGDTVKTIENNSFTITDRHDLNGCLIYQGDDTEGNEVSIHEMDLSSHVQFSQPQDRLFAGQIDKNRQFELRVESLSHQHRLQQSSIFGLMGPRVQLLPHQMYIAHQVSQRHAPRVLLADEVGLGKTIEAGLIAHQQLITGRAERLLIVVPDSLLHQWLVEMLRRFNLHFTIMDQQRYQAINETNDINPFESAQLVLCNLSLLTGNQAIYNAACDAHWDLMIVDEAHHLQWDEKKVSLEYQCIEGLAKQVLGLLLLTATPEQLGVESHFARLRLLDPDRYHDLEIFKQEEAAYRPVSDLVEAIVESSDLTQLLDAKDKIDNYLSADAYDLSLEFSEVKQQIIDALLDRHGTGRILYRNTRDAVQGFPERHLNSYPLSAPHSYLSAKETDLNNLLQTEHILGDDWVEIDSRVQWLVDWLSGHKLNKVLLICSQAETAQALELYLRVNKGIRSSVFHEGLSLVNRDRSAAYFADEEEGAQILICSEIGSEGRNFQFAHHLILFDLPLNPDLLEQRIGRLDRIGQKHTIQIHIPYYEQSAQAVLLNWYHQGMNALERVFPVGSAIYQTLKQSLHNAMLNTNDTRCISKLIKQTQELTDKTLSDLQNGRDRLLELNSCNFSQANDIVADIDEAGNSYQLASFMDKVFDEYGVDQQTHSADCIIVEPGSHMLHHHFPALPEDGLTATYKRHRALVREDMAFLNWEHPMVLGSLDMIINSDFGNTAFCTLEHEALQAGSLLLEAVFKLSCPAPKDLQVERYLSCSYLRIVTDQQGHNLAELLDEDTFNESAGRIPTITKQELVKRARPNITTLVEQAKKLAETQQKAIIQSSLAMMTKSLQTELTRLVSLAEVNKAIRDDEISYIEQKQQVLQTHIEQAELRLDAVRVAIVTED